MLYSYEFNHPSEISEIDNNIDNGQIWGTCFKGNRSGGIYASDLGSIKKLSHVQQIYSLHNQPTSDGEKKVRDGWGGKQEIKGGNTLCTQSPVL